MKTWPGKVVELIQVEYLTDTIAFKNFKYSEIAYFSMLATFEYFM